MALDFSNLINGTKNAFGSSQGFDNFLSNFGNQLGQQEGYNMQAPQQQPNQQAPDLSGFNFNQAPAQTPYSGPSLADLFSSVNTMSGDGTINPNVAAINSPTAGAANAMMGAQWNEQQAQKNSVDPTPTIQDTGGSPSAVSGVTVSKSSPGLPPVSQGAVNSVANSYDNRALVRGIDQVNQGAPQHTGMFGMHGTLRDVLGTLGDAFLMKDGHQPMYQPQRQAERIGDASTGFTTDPQHAIERLRALGIPQANELAQHYQEQFDTQQLRQATIDNTAAYREGALGNRADVLKDRQLNQATPIIAGILKAGADTKDPVKYAQAYQRATQYAKARNIDINDVGAPDKLEDYQAGYGLTANQGQVSDDKAAGRATSTTNAGIAAGSRVQSAQIGAGARPSSDALLNQIISKKSLNDEGRGPALTSTQQQVYDAYITRKNQGRGGSTLHFTPSGSYKYTATSADGKQKQGSNDGIHWTAINK